MTSCITCRYGVLLGFAFRKTIWLPGGAPQHHTQPGVQVLLQSKHQIQTKHKCFITWSMIDDVFAVVDVLVKWQHADSLI